MSEETQSESTHTDQSDTSSEGFGVLLAAIGEAPTEEADVDGQDDAAELNEAFEQDGDQDEAQADEADGGEEQEQPEAPDRTPRQKRMDRIFAAARRMEDEGKRALAEAQSIREQVHADAQRLEQQRQQMSSLAHAVDLWNRDPGAALREVARLTGKDHVSLFRSLQERELRDGGMGPEEAQDRIAEMERRFEQRITELEQRRAQEQQQAAAAQAEQEYRRICSNHATDARFAERWPELALLDPQDFQGQLYGAWNTAARMQPELLADKDKFLDRLEEIAAKRYAAREQRKAERASSVSGDTAPNDGEGESQREPDSRTKRSPKSRGKPTPNATKADAGGAGRPRSDRARREAVHDWFYNEQLADE